VQGNPLTAFNVTRRTQEIGIRMALGAARGNVLRLVMQELLILAAAGLAIGVAASLALGRLIESQLFEMKASDPGFDPRGLPSRAPRHTHRSGVGAALGVRPRMRDLGVARGRGRPPHFGALAHCQELAWTGH
jgi:ABC-type antimicrobial peptide transport system permease subunit